jgi:response regulator RpfG family c-di-GMP phosphodiesterase
MLHENLASLAELPAADRPRPSILIVEDDPDTCDLICLFLSREYDCEGVNDGRQALDRIRTSRYSVIVADLMMPEIDGYSVISSASILAPTTPVIVVSGISETHSAIKAMRMGAFDYIIKPFEPDQVDVSVKRALSHHQMAEATRSYERRLAEYAAELEALNKVLSTALAELDSNYHSTVAALAAAIEARSFDTRGHSDRVVGYSMRLGAALGLDEVEMRALELGALFHDIGKIGIQDHILLKPEALTDAEWDQMRTHPEKGARIIASIPYLRPALPVVLQHHERWDGTGYPVGLAGERIDLKARIFAVADAIDAITSDRVYDSSRSFEAACDELRRGAGKQFDPRIVQAFCDIPLPEWAAIAGGKSKI